jgi:hypothetical protein
MKAVTIAMNSLLPAVLRVGFPEAASLVLSMPTDVTPTNYVRPTTTNEASRCGGEQSTRQAAVAASNQHGKPSMSSNAPVVYELASDAK